MPTAADVAGLRSLLADLTGQASDDLAALWRTWPLDDPPSVRDLAVAAVIEFVQAYGDAAAGWTADLYDQWRDDAGVTGRFSASPADLATEDQVAAGVRNAVGSLYGETADVGAALTLMTGSMTRHIMAGSRDTIVGNTVADPKATGWERHVRSGACKFCRMLAGRGGVYRKDTVQFKAHDHCHCVAAPSWDPDAEEAITVAYVASKRKRSASDRARVKAFLADM